MILEEAMTSTLGPITGKELCHPDHRSLSQVSRALVKEPLKLRKRKEVGHVQASLLERWGSAFHPALCSLLVLLLPKRYTSRERTFWVAPRSPG